MNTAKQRHNN